MLIAFCENYRDRLSWLEMKVQISKWLRIERQIDIYMLKEIDIVSGAWQSKSMHGFIAQLKKILNMIMSVQRGLIGEYSMFSAVYFHFETTAAIQWNVHSFEQFCIYIWHCHSITFHNLHSASNIIHTIVQHHLSLALKTTRLKIFPNLVSWFCIQIDLMFSKR